MKVTIENHDGNLRLRWTCPETGKRKTLALGVPDSTAGRSSALGLKDRIESDIKHGYYDATLLRYRPKTIGKNPTEITTVELFDRFTQYQAKKLTKSSIDARYQPVIRMLEKHLNIEAGIVDRRRADRFADVCEDTLSPGTAKARIQLLRAAWGWGKDKYQLSIDNPWDGLAERFKAVDTQPVAAFSRDEVSKIIKGFKDSPYGRISILRDVCGERIRCSHLLGMGWHPRRIIELADRKRV